MVELRIGCVTGNSAILLDRALDEGFGLSWKWNREIIGQLDIYIDIEDFRKDEIQVWENDQRIRIAQVPVIPQVP